VSRESTDFPSLFRFGVEELDLALGDPDFLKYFLPRVSATNIGLFRDRLRTDWKDPAIRSLHDAQTQALEVALAAHKNLGMKLGLVILEMAAGACSGLDEHTLFLTPGQLSELYASLEGESAGIGAEVVVLERKALISQVIPAGPAAQANLRPGDVIVRIDRQVIKDMSPDTIAALFQGPAGTTVDVEIHAGGETRSRTVTLTRQAVNVPSVFQVHMLRPELGIGYFHLACLQKTTPREIDDAILQLKMQGLKGLIIDLRGNPGGLFEAAIETTERFLSEGVIVATQSQVREQNRTYRAHNPAAFAIPLIVLIDGDTASAAEVIAGALKDNQRATVVGQPTFGKGSIQRILPLESFQAGIRVTLGQFFSPRGQAYSPGGVTPHIFAEKNFMSQNDQPLEIATQELVHMLEVR
jgi:carboxyl-terminal processing protease